MRRRPSGSADEDERDHGPLLDPPAAATAAAAAATAAAAAAAAAATATSHTDLPDPQRLSFSSSKFDAARHSDTIDRRKADRPLVAAVAAARGESWPRADESKSKEPLPASPLAGGRHGELHGRWRSQWRISRLTLITTAAALILLVTIVHAFLSRQVDPKGCRQCYMYPGYAKLDGFDTEHTRFASKYSLYLYREIGVDEDTRVQGVPVLFVTGNAGSYKQVRPIAAEAARYFAEHIQPDESLLRSGMRNLDFFTADFNEDITAFHGQTMLDQAEFLNDAVAYILSLYHDPQRSRRDPGLPDPTSVIIVGHSMGGIVARTMLVMPNYQANSINTILTMAAPHARAPVSFDADIVRVYDEINDYWQRAYSHKWANDNPLWHVTLVSIAGGGLDTIVPSDYASTAALVPDTHGFTVFTSAIPTVWTGSDHLSILWCDQMRKVMVRAIMDVVDVNRPSQTKPRAYRMKVFKQRFLSGMERIAEKTLPDRDPTTLLTLEDPANAILAAGERLVIEHLGAEGKSRAHLLPIPPHSKRDSSRFTLLSNQVLDDVGGSGALEVLFCSVYALHHGQSASLFALNMDLSESTTGATRLACKNAAPDAMQLPASYRNSHHPFDDTLPFSYLQYDSASIAEHQFVAVVDKGQNQGHGWVVAEFASSADATMAPRIGLGSLLTRGLHLTLPAHRPLVNEIAVPAIHSSLLAYKLRLEPNTCAGALFAPLVRQSIAEPFESKFFVNVQEADINLHGIAPFMPPAPARRYTDAGLTLQIWSDPTCATALDVSLKVDVLGSLGKLYMRYRTVFPAIPLVIVALVLRKQFMFHDQTGIFMTFTEALDLCLRRSLPSLLMAMTLLGLSLSTSSPHPAGPPATGLFAAPPNATDLSWGYRRHDLLLGSQDTFFWFLIPLCGLLSLGFCILMHYTALLLVRICAIVFGIVTFTRRWLRSEEISRRNLGPAFAAPSPSRRLALTALLLVLVATIIPYQFAYMVACFVQVATCTRAYLVAAETRSAGSWSFYNYSHSLLVLMLWVLPINLPVLVVWVRNLEVHWLTPFTSHHNVLAIAPFILLVETLTGGSMIPRLSARPRNITNILFFTLAVYAAVVGISFAYQLHQLANLVAAWLVMVHVSGPHALGALFGAVAAPPSRVRGGGGEKQP